jgi:hypothetical protein
MPRSEQEYEAWARKQYAHIMALYDILTGKQCGIPADLPDSIRAFLALLMDEAAKQSEPLWYGAPVKVHDWGRRLYDACPGVQAPTGWRALLIYSGELLMFDWPVNDSEPNVRPRLDAVKSAAAVAGYGTSFWAMNLARLEPPAPDEYVQLLVADIGLARRTLEYVAVSSSLTELPQFKELAQSAIRALAASRLCGPACGGNSRSALFQAIFESRTAQLKLVAEAAVEIQRKH